MNLMIRFSKASALKHIEGEGEKNRIRLTYVHERLLHRILLNIILIIGQKYALNRKLVFAIRSSGQNKMEIMKQHL